MNVLSILIKTIAVFDLIVIAVYFGGDIFSTVLGKFRKKPVQKDDFEFYDEDTADVPLSIDSIRLLCSGDVTDFVKEQLLPGAAKTMDALVESERTAVLLLLSALIGFLKEEGRMDEQNFPMVMELLNHAKGTKEDDEKDPVDMLLDEEARHIRRDYYNDYQRYQLMQVDKNRVILACRIIINDLLGKLYRYDYRFGYDLLLTEENSIERKLYHYGQDEWEVEEYEP